MNRDQMLARVCERTEPWDLIVIGGGATGMGVAVDAATRGYDVLLVEQSDFGKGTSSRSTKLVHGGVRYLEQGNLALVMEALEERGRLRNNAPHLVRERPFIVPTYEWWESPFYGLGLKIYNFLAGKYGFGPSQILSSAETLSRLPTIRAAGLRGGVVYHDGQFDDARLLVHLARTAASHGATLLNYARVIGIRRDSDGLVCSVTFLDVEAGQEHSAPARVIVNATGCFCDRVRQIAQPQAHPLVAPSQGTHLVLSGRFLPGESALMVPHTRDGRVMFAIPWHDHTLVGTTDVPVATADLEPRATPAEVDFLLETAAEYLAEPPTRADVLSVFAGIRPLVAAGSGRRTAALSRSHTIEIDASGLLTITGGKWTTYRKMAEACVDHAAVLGHLPDRACVTRELPIHGFDPYADRFGPLAPYGADAEAIVALAATAPDLSQRLHPELPYVAAEVVWAARQEMARTVDDVLARRTRALQLNSRAAIAMAPATAQLLARELGRDAAWAASQVREFLELARHYGLTAGPAD